MIDENGFRLNVGIILTNYNQRVFFGKRINKNVWQFPQGGLKNNESHVNGMFRELKEEIGLTRDDVIIIGKTTKWLSYEIPKSYLKGTSNYKGQKQIWFLLKFIKEDIAIDLNTTTKPEFDQWTWIKYEDAIKKTAKFKSFVYKKAYSELSSFFY
tara:strand:- start:844 stop:1308 length:465 start_codon:yes stop_codon:yes gene_type:complete